MKQKWIIYTGDIDLARDMLGYIPDFLDTEDPRPAKQQLDSNYQHGGGWRPMDGFTFHKGSGTLRYPGDPAFKPVASTYLPLTEETVVVFHHSFVGIFKDAKLIECARMD